MKLNKLLLKQISTITLLIGSFIILFLYLSTLSEIKLTGKIIDFGARVSDTGIYSFLIVDVDNKSLRISYDKASKFDIGKKVIINKKTTKLFGLNRYTLKRVLNP